MRRAVILASLVAATPAHATAWSVCQAGCDYTEIATATADNSVISGDVLDVRAKAGGYSRFSVLGKQLTIQQDPAFPGAFVSDSGDQVTVDLAGDLTLDGLEIRGGGRGVWVRGASTVRLIGLVVTGSDPNDDGGAFFVEDVGSVLTLESSTIQNAGRTQKDGGAGWVLGALYAFDTSFVGNVGASGGAVLVTGGAATASFERCRFEANEANTTGGAVAVVDGGVDLGDTVLVLNVAGTRGGAIFASNADLTPRRVRLCDNQSGDEGGGIFSENGALDAAEALFAENGSGVGGAGLHVASGDLSLSNASFLDNVAPVARGAVVLGGGSAEIANTLFADNTGFGLWSAIAATHAYDAYDGNSAGTVGGAGGLVLGATDVLAPPQLVSWNPASAGACDTQSPWPAAGSPLVDAGDPARSDAVACSPSDIGAFRGPHMAAPGTDLDADGLVWETESALSTDPCAADTDGDGLDDSAEWTLDTDPLNPDADQDGVQDGDEAGAGPGLRDTDGDGLPDVDDPDDDGDGALTSTEDHDGNGSIVDDDLDGDGLPDFLDDDDDGDGSRRIEEDRDGNGDPEDDDTDGDGSPDWLDDDDDDDGIPTALEVAQDGEPLANADPDGDGLQDAEEWNPLAPDTDGDGRADFNDPDDDNDGLDTLFEGSSDADGDGEPNHLDTDSDNDGKLDLVEGSGDSDNDTLVNFLDPDDDDGVAGDPDLDGLTTAVELAAGSIPSDPDTDGDLVPDGEEFGPGIAPQDTDGDAVKDLFDLDDDGDGIPTTDEIGAPCTVEDLVSDLSAGALRWLCDDESSIPVDPRDTDQDGFPDGRDPDDDGDGTPTALEDRNANQDWTDDDLDGDGTADWLDANDFDGPNGDIDRDGIPTRLEETGPEACPDANLPDTDRDGLEDGEEIGEIDDPTDTDGDGRIDACDSDDDGDGLLTAVEGGADPDGDGLPAWLDTDSDGDGIPDGLEPAGDVDCDGLPDRLDEDPIDGLCPNTATPSDAQGGTGAGCDQTSSGGNGWALLVLAAIRRRSVG